MYLLSNKIPKQRKRNFKKYSTEKNWDQSEGEANGVLYKGLVLELLVVS